VVEAIGGALGTAACIGHEALFTGVDLLQFVPVPGLDVAGKVLLNIWDAIEMVEVSVMGYHIHGAAGADRRSPQTNLLASLRLTKRCADILISIRDEIKAAGDMVAEELRVPIAKLEECVLLYLRIPSILFCYSTQGVW
jgi:abelson tyrosine-protein kinase 1